MRISGRIRLRCFVLQALVLGVSLWVLPSSAQAQVFVYPRRPSQTNVRWKDFNWSHIDVLIGPKASGETAHQAGPRMHYGVGPGVSGPHTTPLGAGGQWDWTAARMMRQAPGGGVGGPRASADKTDAGKAKQASNGDGVAGTGLAGTGVAGAGSPSTGVDATGKNADVPPWTGGVRLYFYKHEKKAARWAAGYIAQMYRELVHDFNYVPRKTFPYFLYSSYQEFMQTNIFPIQEGVLGVTSPKSLEVTLPYFGDHALFRDVSKHELTHEFTIQKVATYAKKHNAAENPLNKMPLWFVEGIAEYYAKEGLDPKTETLVRDLVVNPNAEEGYVLEGFFDDQRHSFLWTYKLGQARCAFLEEVYGKGTLQKILEQAYKMVGDKDGKHLVGDFPALLTDITGDSPKTITTRFENWVKRRHFRTYLEADQSTGILQEFDDGDGIIQALGTSPDGHVLMYRSISAQTGQRHLYLVDYRAPDDAETVAADGSPGMETLHPVAGRNFDVGADSLAFVAQDEDRDVIYWQPYQHQVDWVSGPKPDKPKMDTPKPPNPEPIDTSGDSDHAKPGKPVASSDASASKPDKPARRVGDVDLDLGTRVKFRLGKWHIASVSTLALAPDGKRIAFVGLTDKGQKDLFLLEPKNHGNSFTVHRLTDDPYAEREISWGKDGIIFTSDATEHGYYNIFEINPKTKDIQRLTYEDRDHSSPRMLDDGRVFFVAYDDVGANVYQAVGPGLVRKTGLATALSDLSPAPDGGLWALQYRGGEQYPARIPASRLMSGDISTQALEATAYTLPHPSLARAENYDVWDWNSWDVGNIFGIVGASSEGIAGQVYATASDKLRDHTVILNMLAYGSVKSIDGSLFYINQQHRLIWGGGLFQDVGYRLDRTFPEDSDVKQFISEERFFGVTGTARYPFSRFTFLQGSLALGGLDFFLFDGTKACVKDPNCIGAAGVYQQWDQANADVRFQAEPSVSVGYNTIRYHPQTGPFMGHSLLLSGTYDWQPFRNSGYTTLRLDAEQYWSLWGRTNFFLRGGTGYTFGSRFARSFFLSSFDTLRGVNYGDFNYLLGRTFFFSTAELQFPLNFLVHVPFLDLEGIAGVDFGAAADNYRAAWNRRVLDAAVGVNFGLGPFVFRLHFAKPFDTGAVAVPNNGDWNTNFSLAYRYW